MNPVIAIFDIGKTNKKLFLFDEEYHIVYERSARLEEIEDEDGFPCEDVHALSQWVLGRLKEVVQLKDFFITAINFSAYGASLVYVDGQGKPLAPIYNYLKPYPERLSDELYSKYGGKEKFCIDTASPALGSLNSGLQLYRLKKEQPEIFGQIKYALHLPQYISSLVSGQYANEITGIGCHTAMWDFKKNQYHQWMIDEALVSKFPPIRDPAKAFDGKDFKVGIGMHDSSAALIPYLISVREPFVLLSTGTWSISLNPFEHSELTADELNKDCLCYLQYNGRPVKASRLFAGHEHEEQVKRIGLYFHRDVKEFNNLPVDHDLIGKMEKTIDQNVLQADFTNSSGFELMDIAAFEDHIEAYHQLILHLVRQQVFSTQLVLKGTDVRNLFVDGGFSQNHIYMHMLAKAFPQTEVYAASVPQASAVGAALVIHDAWNVQSMPVSLIGLKKY